MFPFGVLVGGFRFDSPIISVSQGRESFDTQPGGGGNDGRELTVCKGNENERIGGRNTKPT